MLPFCSLEEHRKMKTQTGPPDKLKFYNNSKCIMLGGLSSCRGAKVVFGGAFFWCQRVIY